MCHWLCYSRASMRRRSFTGSATAFVLLLCTWHVFPQAALPADQSQNRYTLQLPVDEVVLTFHAVDAHGLPVNDLKANEIRLLDNGSPPRRVIAFDSIVNRPIRAAILLDTSESMQQSLSASKRIAQRFAEHIFRQEADQAIVIDFAFISNFRSQWSGNALSISQSIQNVRLGAMNPAPGTAIYNAIFRTCAYDFKDADPAATGNLILLFSDGEDNAGLTSLEEALRACQHSNTVIYAFRIRSSDSENSTGPKKLVDLAANTGGRVFPAEETPDAIWNDLKTIESEMRNQYRLIYKPANLKHDGAFHAIELQLPDRVDQVEVRSGYFASRQ
jgi:Ca-activated chloride channel homolog